jgi:hypothetical protein
MKSRTSSLFVLIALIFGFLASGRAQQAQPAPAAPAAAPAPAAAAPAPAAAAPALTPNPEWIHQTLKVFVYPAKGQAPEQQQKDETECYTWARGQTGIDPTGPATAPAATPEKVDNPANGARAAGAARGAAGGAVIGAIAGDAGKGAAIGATA